jgi:hypothetical protein
MSELNTSPATPIAFSDAYFKDYHAAVKEAEKRRTAGASADWLTRIEPSPYAHGFVVRSVPIELMLEFAGDVCGARMFGRNPLRWVSWSSTRKGF